MFPFDQQCYAVVSREHLREPLVVISTGDWDQSLSSFPSTCRTIHYGNFFRTLPEAGTLSERETYLKTQTIDRAPRKNALDALIAAIEETGLANKCVALDETAFNRAFRPELEQRLPKMKVVPGASLFKQIRLVKTDEEVRRLRRAAAVTEQAIRAAAAIGRPGVTERTMAQEFQRSVIAQGGEPEFTMVHFGRNAALGQLPPDDTPLRPGDSIWFDVGCRLDGFWSDLARMFVLGEPSAKLQRYYQAVLAGEEDQIRSTHPGMTAEDIFNKTVEVVRNAGIPHYRRTHVGHGIGVEVYDPPLLAPGQSDVIQTGMILNFETPYYELGWGAVHVEDPVLIRENGNELLTTLSRELGILG
jgi:Xaa-Pro aminopeptidase